MRIYTGVALSAPTEPGLSPRDSAHDFPEGETLGYSQRSAMPMTVRHFDTKAREASVATPNWRHRPALTEAENGTEGLALLACRPVENHRRA